MRLGTSIFLSAVGAILAFAVHQTVSGVDLRMIGIILMVAGVIGILLELAFFAPRRRQTTVSSRHVAVSSSAPVQTGSGYASTNLSTPAEVDQGVETREVTERY